MSSRNGPAGLRCSTFDGFAILACVATVSWGYPWLGPQVLLPLVVLGHFFLFCNVFRIRRSYELIWAGVFMANFCGWVAAEAFSWPGLLALQTPVTVLLIAMEMRSPRYHGIFWQRVNPDYLAARLAFDAQVR